MGVEHIVQAGETIRTIAMSHGVPDWRSIYDHPRNSELQHDRPDPNILHPGDVVYVDDAGEAVVLCTGVPVPCRTGRSYTFSTPPMVPLNLRLVERDGEILSNQSYELVAGPYRSEGTSDGEGHVRDQVPMDARRAELRVQLRDGDDPPTWCMTVELNTAHPPTTVEGVQSRLQNLGYYTGPIDGEESLRLRDAIEQFQRVREGDVTGVIDDRLRDSLRSLHPA